jgi:AMP-polyphosphate phosphotransferase
MLDDILKVKLKNINLNKSLTKEKYYSKLDKLIKKLTYLRLLSGGALSNSDKTPPILILFEGWDASGKGGAIKRVTSNLDPRHYKVVSFSAPSEEEKKEHFLARFWKHMPKKAELVIMDRSWYGRVLVERVEKYASEEEWTRGYEEINNLEKTLKDNGVILIKFFMHISKEEQQKRFEERESNLLKNWKITEEDYRNASKYEDYSLAIEDAVNKTQKHFKWNIVSSEDKYYARIRVIKTIIKKLEKELNITKYPF